ncbi:MAG: hypothetical protein IT230_06690 [Flavobacteriales bacterium]|nr:hypothetical protein [Flavobacteriales bacterium]
MKYFALVMGLAYIGVGASVLLAQGFLPQITRFRAPLGIVLIGYGLLRAAMWKRKYAPKRHQGE